MSLNKSILYGKEHRKPYQKAKAYDGSCRNHGSCEYCKRNRMYQSNKKKLQFKQGLEDYYKEKG